MLHNYRDEVWTSERAVLFSPLIKNVLLHRNPHKTGIPIGRILNDTRIIFWDPFKAINPHILIVGPTGSGKTETLLAILRRAHIIYNSTIIFVDVKGDIIKRLIEREIDHVLIDIPDTSLGSLEPYYTSSWLRLYQVFDSIVESYEIDDLRLQGALFKILKKVYEKKDVPKWEDVFSEISEEEDLNGIIERILREIASLDRRDTGHYKIVKNKINVITLRSLSKEREELLRYAINMIFQDMINMTSRENPDDQVKTFLGLDEAWMLLSRGLSKRIINLMRLARGYGLSVALATQDFRDFGENWDLIVENIGLLIIMSNPNRNFWREASDFLKINNKLIEDLMILMKRGDAVIRILPDPRPIPISIDIND